MLQSLLRNNFRAKLVIPVLIALLVMIISSITFTVVTQRSSSNALNKQVGTSFVDIESSIGDDLGELSQQLDNSLQRMQEEVSSRIEKSLIRDFTGDRQIGAGQYADFSSTELW